jgi:hypothetical protein
MSQQQPSKRAPLATGRRIPLTVTVDVDTYVGLKALGNGNRSAAIEHLYRAHMAKQRALLLADPAIDAP